MRAIFSAGALVRIAFVTISLSAAVAAVAQTTAAFDLPSEPLADSLRAIASQTHSNILFDASLVQGLLGRPLNARLGLDDALRRLLADTGLTYHRADQSTVVITRVASPVQATAVKTADPPDPAASAGSAEAAPADQSAAPATNSESESLLQEVVVTAERRATDVQTTPIAVTALSGAQLTAQNLTTLESLQTSVPGFQDDYAGGLQLFNIRGVGNSQISAGIVPGVAILRDGLLMGETTTQTVPEYDIRDVEVLKGPQGTFVGASSTGGAIQINSNDPSLEPDVHGYAHVQYGSYNDTKLDGAVNLPIGATFAMRLAFNDEQRNSFYRDVGAQGFGTTQSAQDPGNLNSRDLRLGLLWQPSSSFQSLTKISYNLENNDGIVGQETQSTYTTLFNNGGSNANSLCTTGAGGQLVCPAPGTVTHSLYYSSSTHEPYVVNYPNVLQKYYSLYRSYEEQLQYTFEDGIQLRSLSGLQDIDGISDALNTNTAVYAGESNTVAGPHDDYLSEEIDAISPTTGDFFSKVNWIAGAFLYYRDTPAEVDRPSVAPSLLVTNTPSSVQLGAYLQHQQSQALFGQISWKLAPALTLQLGARNNWDHLWQSGFPDTTYSYPSMKVLVPGSLQAHYADTVPTWKVGFNWEPTPREPLKN